MSLFHIFRDYSQAEEMQRLADIAGYLKIKARLADARDHHDKMTNNKRIEELENEVAQLTIVLEAMIEIFYESGMLNSDKLASKVAEIDLRDGVADGKITKPKPAAKIPKPIAPPPVKLQTKKAAKTEVKFKYPEPTRKPFTKDTNRTKKY